MIISDPFRAPRPARRSNLRVDVANLDPVSRSFLDTAILILTDPALENSRKGLMAGKIALTIEDGEVTWIDGSRGGER